MAKAKKLPSGAWNVSVYSHSENGKRKYISFTGISKAEVELRAAEYKNTKHRRRYVDLTVAEAVDGYISSKDGVLSPSTIRGYRRMERNNFDGIKGKKIRSLTSEDMQLFVSSLSLSDQSPKSVRNIYALLTASVALYAPDISFRVTLPAKRKKEQISPTDEDVARLFNAADPKLKICIALAAFGSLRRGELCALKYGDIRGDSVYVHADIIQDKDNNWVYKDIPKEAESVRLAPLPHEIIELLGSGDPDEYIVKYAIPNTVSNRFNKLRHKLGIEGIRFHDLRHYYASIGAVLGVPDTYLSDFGGWSRNSSVMKEIYQNKIVPISEIYAKKMTDHFKGVINMQDEMQDEK